jgi:DNA-binding LytR/AlgR family response regulator
MKIAIVDDTSSDLERVKTQLERYGAAIPQSCLSVMTYDHPDDFLKDFAIHPDFDLIFLDMVMPFIDGIAVGQAIRTIDDQVKIVYTTISPEYALNAYDVKAYHYLIKPVSEKQLTTILDELIFQLDLHHHQKLIIRDGDTLLSVMTRKIVYIEVTRHRLYYHLRDGSVVSAYGSLKDLSPIILNDVSFLRVHKSYLINLHAAALIRQREFIMANGIRVPISRMALKAVREAYAEFMTQKRPCYEP